MTQLYGSRGGVILGGRTSCSDCRTTLAEWELALPKAATYLLAEDAAGELVSQLTGAIVAQSTACSWCAEHRAEVDSNERAAEGPRP